MYAQEIRLNMASFWWSELSMQRADCIWLIMVMVAALAFSVWGLPYFTQLVIQRGQSWFMRSSRFCLFMAAPIACAPAKLGRSSSDRHKTGEFAFPDMKKLSAWEKSRPTLFR
ncbi:MAG TPA: hypothetical protein VII37_06225, partial [Candidatus Acidoferrum sp.]